MERNLDTLSTTLPTWLEIIEADDGQYHVMDNSFDDGAMELACFYSSDRAMQFAVRLAGRRAAPLQQR